MKPVNNRTLKYHYILNKNTPHHTEHIIQTSRKLDIHKNCNFTIHIIITSYNHSVIFIQLYFIKKHQN